MASYNNKSIVLHELIGLRARVIKSTDKQQKGIHGAIIDETKNTLLFQTSDGPRRIVKKNSTFRFWKSGKSFVVDGEEINFRSYERIEKGLKFYRRRRL